MLIECSCGVPFMVDDDAPPDSLRCDICGNVFFRRPKQHPWREAFQNWIHENRGTFPYVGLTVLVIAVLAGVLSTAIAEVGQPARRPGVIVRTESAPGDLGDGALGRGVLKVMNDSGSAVAVRLIGPHYSDSRTFLIPVWRDKGVFGLVPGTWTIRYCTGSGWRPDIRRFEFTSACGELEQTIEYTEDIVNESLKYEAAIVRFGPSTREMPAAHPISADDFGGD